MKYFNVAVFNLLLLFLSSCNNSIDTHQNENWDSEKENRKIQEKMDSLSYKLSEPGFFWETGINEILFKDDGTVVLYRPETRIHKNGKWIFDTHTGELTVAWQGAGQFTGRIYGIADDWSSFSTTGEMVDYSNEYGVVKRMKVLDNRFDE